MSQTPPIEVVLGRLPNVRKEGRGWRSRCPAHEDRQASLSVREGDDGRVLLFCHAGCDVEAIVTALGLTLADLFARDDGAEPGDGPAPDGAGLTLEQLAIAKRLPIGFLHSVGCTDAPGPSVRIPYHDVDGNIVAVRFRLALQGARFRWRKGDHVRLYGLERQAAVRAARWVLLVEGESDSWTLWHHGIPAFGIPGKATWREEWASFLAGLDVVLWQEPDAADLVERVARDLPDVRVILPPPGTKDVSEAHVRGGDVVALVERLRAEARPVREILERRAQQHLLETHRAAQSVLEHPDPLVLVESEIAAQGYGGDVRVPMLGYLSVTGRVLAPRRGSMLAHTLFKGPSSGGKNAAMQAGLRLLPPEAVHVIDAGSPRVLIYDDAPLRHRVVVFSEADSLPAGEDNPAASAIRNLLADGHLHYKVTVRDPETGGFIVHEVDKPGPTVLLTTSTRPLGHQLMTRLFSVEVPDEPAQLRAALAAQASLEIDDPPEPKDGLVAFQAYLGALAPIDVVVPYAKVLSDWLGRAPGGPRVLRDYPRLLSLIKAVTVLRIAHRVPDARGRLGAIIDDYAAVHRLVADTYEASAGASKRVRDAVAAVAELTAAKGAGATVSVSEVAARLEVSIASASRRVRDAIVGGWLVNDETRKNQTAKLRLGEPLPSTSLLPMPEELGEAFSPASAANAKTAGAETEEPTVDGPGSAKHEQAAPTPPPADGAPDQASVFTFSPFTDGYRPPPSTQSTAQGPTVGDVDPSVNRENVQTPHESRAADASTTEPDAADWVDVKPAAGPPVPPPSRPTLWDDLP